jgi:hypothetical protein
MSNYKAPRIMSNLRADLVIGTLLASITIGNSGGHDMCLQVVPVRTGFLGIDDQKSLRHVPLHNHDIAVFTAGLMTYSFTMYGFNSGHFVSNSFDLPIQIALAADVRPYGHAMTKRHTSCPRVADSANSLRQNIASSKEKSTVHCYCIYSHRFLKRDTERKFWSTQAEIVKLLQKNRRLVSLFVFVHTSCDMALANGFKRSMQRSGWLMSSTDIYYPDVGNSVADSAAFLLGVHKAATGNHKPIRVAMPPSVCPDSLASFIYKPFNSKEYVISLARHQPDFDLSECTGMNPISSVSDTKDQRDKCIYQMHRACDDKGVFAGSGVYCLSGLCPPFCASNNNPLASTFGIEFSMDEDTFVRPISTYKVTSCFKLDKDVTYFYHTLRTFA